MQIEWHPEAAEEFAALADAVKRRIAKAMSNRGAAISALIPYGGNLKDYRKFRVGDYRLICRAMGNRMIILAVVHRSIAYQPKTAKRLAKRGGRS